MSLDWYLASSHSGPFAGTPRLRREGEGGANPREGMRTLEDWPCASLRLSTNAINRQLELPEVHSWAALAKTAGMVRPSSYHHRKNHVLPLKTPIKANLQACILCGANCLILFEKKFLVVRKYAQRHQNTFLTTPASKWQCSKRQKNKLMLPSIIAARRRKYTKTEKMAQNRGRCVL
jgi:hypothetical protein